VSQLLLPNLNLVLMPHSALADSYLSQCAHDKSMKVDQWIKEQKKKYEDAVKDHTKQLVRALEHENPEGAEKFATALWKSQWYLDEILPLFEQHAPKPAKKTTKN